jgi:predicted histidine transporter YuiF (NhaC family)
LCFAGILDDFWRGMSVALISIGISRTVHIVRYSKDEAYREKMETEKNDERSHFLRNKAWAWAGYLFVLLASVSTIVLKLLGQDLLCIAAGGAVCVIILLYWISYEILRRKY